MIGPEWNPFDPADAARAASGLDWLVWLSGALELRSPADEDARVLRETYRTSGADASLGASLGSLARAWRALEESAAPKIRSGVLAEWASPRRVVDAWGDTRASRALDTTTSLQRWVDFARALAPLKNHGLSGAYVALISGRVTADDASIAFEKGVATASLIEREAAQGGREDHVLSRVEEGQ